MNNSIQQLKEALADKKNDDVVHISKATKNNGEYTTPYPIGYKVLDDAIRGGVRAGDLVICTGLSGHGKTTALQCISVNLSNTKQNTLWFSYELLIDNLYAKFKEMNCDCKHLKLYTPKQMITGNLKWIQEKIEEGLKKYNTKFVFIDHIDFLTPKDKPKNNEQKRMIIRSICMELKTLAIELKITIFLISHVKKVQGRAIEMQDLTESSSLYQLADVVLVAERYIESAYIGGKKTETLTSSSALRFLKNRITGQLAIMNFHLENGKIIPDDVEVPTTKIESQVKQELVVTNKTTNEIIKENKFRKNIFGEHN